VNKPQRIGRKLVRKSKLNKIVKKAFSKARNNLNEEANHILSKNGGNYIPDFGFPEHIQYKDQAPWK
jgi:uncharacterized lipoprotein YehR (DUF1307 family)